MKKLINNPNNVLNNMIYGIVAAYPEYVKRLEGFNVIVRIKKENKVALVSGIGSGHEPAYVGYIGYGMLDEAICGEVFTSLTPDKVYEAIKATDDEQRVLLIIKLYYDNLYGRNDRNTITYSFRRWRCYKRCFEKFKRFKFRIDGYNNRMSA